MQIIVFGLIVIAFLWRHKTRGYFESVEKVGCHNTEFRLSCGSLNGSIIIFEAIFSQNDHSSIPSQTSCQDPGHSPNISNWKLHELKNWENFFYWRNSSKGTVEVTLMKARVMTAPGEDYNVNHIIHFRFNPFSENNMQCFMCARIHDNRCSGVNYCSFVLNEDFEAASGLGPGAVYLRYSCVDGIHAIRTCNSNIDVTAEGFVRTPGYPDYYVGDTTCVWTLRAPPPQRVRIDFLDISLRGLAPYEVNCLDWLVVSEDGLDLLSTCGDITEDTSIVSDGSALNVTFKSSSKTLYPKRGFLFHYKAVGCPSLQKPRDGYLINGNETFAHYRCSIGFIFPDTVSRDKTLKCYNENTWDDVILDCVNATEILNQKNNSDLAVGARREMEKSDSLKDVIVPSIVMCILFIGNAVVLYLIYRQRNKLNTSEKMEMKEMTSLPRNLRQSPS